MASGKRASMREGPLAALFRKTETEGLEQARRGEPPPRPRAVPPSAADEPEAPRMPDAAGAPAPRLLLRHPRQLMAPPEREPSPPSSTLRDWRPARPASASRSCASSASAAPASTPSTA